MKLIFRGEAELGESALWDAELQHLHWLDLRSSQLLSLAPDGSVSTHSIDVAPPLGAIVQTDTSPWAALLAGQSIFDLDVGTGMITARSQPIAVAANTHFNDATVSPDGQLWAGTEDSHGTEPTGSLWQIIGPKAAAIDSGFVCVNGPAFSPDGSWVYVSDSIGRRILRYPPHSSEGTTFFTFSAHLGLPDGLAVDQHGDLWVATWSGASVMQLSRDARLKQIIPAPARLVTSLAFGGDDMRTLFITTARTGLSAAELAESPLSGSLFAIRVAVPGVPIPRWRLR